MDRQPHGGSEYTTAAEAYYLLRTGELAEEVTDHGITPEPLFTFIRADNELTLIRIDRAAATRVESSE
ncbi:MAG: hypothetical protein GY778_11745 [bacterium]|nr:hypothetical protein [bacterium]